jgi:peptide/nickel transport system substrate-binding protein
MPLGEIDPKGPELSMMLKSLTGTERTMWALARRYLALFCLGLLLVVSLAACSADWLRNQSSQGTQIIESQLGDPKTFNYALNNSTPNVFGYIYEGLITENPITTEVEPALAESWTIAPDKKTITFTLRDGLKWSDGQPLTVDDVVFTFQSIYFNEDIPTDIQDVLRIGNDRKLPIVKKVGPRQVQFVTPEPFAPFLRSLDLAIMPQHALKDNVQSKEKFQNTWKIGSDPKAVITNGPYTLESFTSNQRVIFRRNPNYWRRDAQGNAQPYVERLIWNLVDNRDTTLLKFRSGESDLIEPLRPEDFPLLKAEEKRGKFKIHVGGARPMTTFLAFNLNQGKRDGKPVVEPRKAKWFNNTAFRQAVAYAIDRNKMNTNAYRGLGVLLHSTLSAQSPYYLDAADGLKIYDYNIETAKKLLLGAGFKYNGNQLIDAAGNPVEFTLNTNAENTLRVALTAQIKQDLSQIGIKVNLNPLNFNVLLDKLDQTFDWDAYLLGFGNGLEPHSGSNIWQPDGSSHNFNQRSDGGRQALDGQTTADWEAEIGRLYTQGASELDEAKRKVIYGKIQKITQEQLPWIPLVVERIMAVGRNKIEGVRYPESGGLVWNVQELRVKE